MPAASRLDRANLDITALYNRDERLFIHQIRVQCSCKTEGVTDKVMIKKDTLRAVSSAGININSTR